MLWARLGEANNLFTEYGVLTDSECLANSSKVTECLELEGGCGAQLVERDHAEGRWFPLSSHDTPHSIFFDIQILLVRGVPWALVWSGDHSFLTTSANEHFSHFGCRNSKYITSEMLLPWQAGHTTRRYMFRTM